MPDNCETFSSCQQHCERNDVFENIQINKNCCNEINNFPSNIWIWKEGNSFGKEFVLKNKSDKGLIVFSAVTFILLVICSVAVLIPLAILVNPLMGILQCLGEELAWRSYLLPRLSKQYPIRIAALINGVIWGIWHSPIIAMGYNYGTEHRILGLFGVRYYSMLQ